MTRLTKLLRKIATAMGIYKIYEKMLEYEIKAEGRLPSHVAVILDGNRRWAREKGVSLEEGYKEGAKRVEEFLNWCYDLGIKTVTLYALSIENLIKRKEEEINILLNILREYLSNEVKKGELIKRKVRIKALGRIELLPKDIIKYIEILENKSKNFNNKYLNIALAYGGRAEIVEAAKRMLKDVLQGKIKIENINEKIFEKYLQTSHLPNPYPDLVIRTSGEMRISNFLLWQIAYSELVFLDVYWPEFRKLDFYRAVRTYQRRVRRFGA